MPKIGRTPRSHKSAPLLHPTPRKTRRIAVYSGSEVFRFSALSARGTGGRLSRDHSGVPGPQRFVRRKIVKNRWAFTILYVHLLYLRTKNIKTPINIITIGRAILYIYYYCYWTVITGVCRVFNKIQNPKNSDRNSLLAAHRSYRRLSYSSGAGWRRTKKKKRKRNTKNHARLSRKCSTLQSGRTNIDDSTTVLWSYNSMTCIRLLANERYFLERIAGNIEREWERPLL